MAFSCTKAEKKIKSVTERLAKELDGKVLAGLFSCVTDTSTACCGVKWPVRAWPLRLTLQKTQA